MQGEVRDAGPPWVGKIPWRRARQPPPVLLPGESNGQRSLAGYSPWGSQKVRHHRSDLACTQADSDHSSTCPAVAPSAGPVRPRTCRTARRTPWSWRRPRCRSGWGEDGSGRAASCLPAPASGLCPASSHPLLSEQIRGKKVKFHGDCSTTPKSACLPDTSLFKSVSRICGEQIEELQITEWEFYI